MDASMTGSRNWLAVCYRCGKISDPCFLWVLIYDDANYLVYQAKSCFDWCFILKGGFGEGKKRKDRSGVLCWIGCCWNTGMETWHGGVPDRGQAILLPSFREAQKRGTDLIVKRAQQRVSLTLKNPKNFMQVVHDLTPLSFCRRILAHLEHSS